jgi:hypothetical protein
LIIDPTVIDSCIGMSLPVAGMNLALQVCIAPQPLASSHIASTVNNTMPSQISASVNPGFEIEKLPEKLLLEVMGHAFVFPGQGIRVSNMNHQSGEPELEVRKVGQPNEDVIPLPPLNELLAMDEASIYWRLRNPALNHFFRYNVFDLTSRNSLKWIKGLPPHYRGQLAHVVLSFNLGSVDNPRQQNIYSRQLVGLVGESTNLRTIKIKVRDFGGRRHRTPAELEWLFLQMPGLELLTRLRGVGELVVDAPFQIAPTQILRLEQCLAKPKGR